MTNSENTPPIDENGKFVTEGWTPEERPRFQFVREIRILEEMRRFTKDVPWMTLNHLMVLLYIFDMDNQEGIEGQTLHKLTGLQKSTINRILHGFTDEGTANKKGFGWIEMRDDPNDKRINRIFLTANGRKLCAFLNVAGGDDDLNAAGVALAMETNMQQSVERGEVGPKRDKDLIELRIFTNLCRSMKEAVKNNLNEVSYRGLLRPLLSWSEFSKKAEQTNILEVAKRNGHWMLFSKKEVTGKSDFLLAPKFILKDETEEELNAFISDALRQSNLGTVTFTEYMKDCAKRLNTVQYKKVRNELVHAVSDVRDYTISPKGKEVPEAFLLQERALAQRMQANAARAAANQFPIASSERQQFLNEALHAESGAAEAEIAVEQLKEDMAKVEWLVTSKTTREEKIAQIERLLKEVKEDKS